ncbi:MAG: hypothetical protein Q9222_005838 [Ikaeria aurantiellina]
MSATTSTCYCGAVQCQYSIEGDNYIGTFICHCTDDRKITSSVFATNFIIKNDTLKFTRGEDNITKFNMGAPKIETGHNMENNFCRTCGSLMFRVSSGFLGKTIMRYVVVIAVLHISEGPPSVERRFSTQDAALSRSSKTDSC